jgi:hypothetical protein
VACGERDFEATVQALHKLMGKGEAASRRELMELHGHTIEVDAWTSVIRVCHHRDWGLRRLADVCKTQESKFLFVG